MLLGSDTQNKSSLLCHRPLVVHDADGDADSGDAAAINALRGSWIGTGPLTIAASVYRAEYDLDRNGVINGSDVLLAQSAAAAALPAGWVSASGAAGGPDSIVGFGGYIFNRETMYYTVRHRHYSPALGRFLERDPAGYIDGSNLFEYCRGGPLSGLDPTGLFVEWLADKGRQAIEGAKELIDLVTGRAKEEDARWVNAIRGDSENQVRQICEALANDKITAEEAERQIAKARSLVSTAASELQSIRDGEWLEIQKTAIEIGTTVATGGVAGRVFTLIRGSLNTVKITHWGAKGATTIRTGEWVMVGPRSIGNWIWSGLGGGGRAYTHTVTTKVARSQLAWPSGWEWIKGFLGQRIYVGP